MNEDDFILNAARTKLSEGNIASMKQISKNGIDWESFEKKAFFHGVGSFIYYSLTNYGLASIIPQNIYDNFKTYYYMIAVKNTALLEELKRVSSIIKDKIILLKGSDLIQNLYPNIAIRSMGDIDILVEKKDVKKIWNNLQSYGFQNSAPLPSLQIYKSKAHTKIAKNQPLSHHLPPLYSDKLVIEIHWNLFAESSLYFITEKAWEAIYQFKDNLYVLSNEMRLVHLSSHFQKHMKNGYILRALCDINEVVTRYADTIDWQKVEEICSNSEALNEVIVTLTYAHLLLKTPVPKEFISEKIRNGKNITLDLLAVRDNKRKSVLVQQLMLLKYLDQPIDIITFIFRIFVPVKEWINAQYNTKTGSELGLAYFKYWSYLFNRHILKKDVKIGN